MRLCVALLMIGAFVAACSSDPPPPKVGKNVGESCAVSTECAVGLRCVGGECTNGTCSAALDCQGTPPDGCSTWACIGGICESACLPDAGGFPDAMTFPDATTFPDAAADGGDAAVSDGDTTDADPADAEPADADLPDSTMPDDSGTPPDDSGTPPDDAGAQPDAATFPDATPPDTGVAPDAGSNCNMTARAPMAGELLVNEVLADPDSATGDANNDGTVDTTDDEFVELVNISASVLELGGLQLADMISARHIFAAGTLGCGQAIVVFSGGNAMHMNWRPNWVLASTGALGLNNTGDQIRVGTSAAMPADIVNDSYGSNAGNNQAIVRTNELVTGSPFILHATHPQAAGRNFSPGTRVDGTAF